LRRTNAASRRCLKRYIARETYHALTADLTDLTTLHLPAPRHAIVSRRSDKVGQVQAVAGSGSTRRRAAALAIDGDRGLNRFDGPRAKFDSLRM
jgi:hypothetical protein